MRNCALRPAARFQRPQTWGFPQFFRSCRLLRLREAYWTVNSGLNVEAILLGVNGLANFVQGSLPISGRRP